MKFQKPDRVRFIFGLVLIVLVYSCFLIFFEDSSFIPDIPRKLRHFITLIFIIIVYLAGIIFLKKIEIAWMKSLWNIIYILGLGTILLIGSYDWIFLTGKPNENLSSIARTIQELLISPILFVAMGLLHKSLVKAPK